MSSYTFTLHLYRSNPIIYRELKIPASFSAADTAAAICLSLGIAPTVCELRGESGERLPSESLLSDLFGAGKEFRETEGSCILYFDESKLAVTSLTVFYRIVKEERGEMKVPTLVDGTGILLPEKVFQVGKINEFQELMKMQEVVTLPGIGTFLRGQHEYRPKKIQNMILAHFASDDALILRMELGTTRSSILENRSMNDLEEIVEQYHAYPNQKRKAAYISAILKKKSEVTPHTVFRDLDAMEYRAFRTLVTTGKCESIDNGDTWDEFPTLSRRGMISVTRKNGPLVADELLTDYAEWFDSEQEVMYQARKLFEAVSKGCAQLYGICFRRDIDKVLEVLYPGEISPEVLDRIWKEYQKPGDGETLIGQTVLYERDDFSLFLRALNHDDTPRKIPDRTSLELLSRKGLYRQVSVHYDMFYVLKPYTYSDVIARNYCGQAFERLQAGEEVAAVADYLVKQLRYLWGMKETVRKSLINLLEMASAEIPRYLYYGYTPAEAEELGLDLKADREYRRLRQEAMAAAEAAAEADGKGRRRKK